MSKLLVGHQINIQHGFLTTVDYAQQTTADVFQIFLKNPRGRGKVKKTDEELATLKKKCKKAEIPVVVHASYLLNFCRSPSDPIHKNSIASLKEDVVAANKLGAIGVVIHMGSNVTKLKLSEAIDNYVSGIREILQKTEDMTIILETGSAEGNEVGSLLPELECIYNRFTKEEKERIGFCLDTCHIFATGYDLSSYFSADLYLRLFDEMFGLDKVKCIHLNDSKGELRCKKDRHADPGAGFIWNKRKDGLFRILMEAEKRKIPVILETPCDTPNHTHTSQMEMLRDLLKFSPWRKFSRSKLLSMDLLASLNKSISKIKSAKVDV